ncbi:MAG: hypothetical protein ACTSRG_21580 [Candidatus Helarchaeota archaeon]
MKANMVLTTINHPFLLSGYYKNFKKYGHLNDIKVIVIPDKKTPKSIYNYCNKLRNKGLKIECPTLNQQEEFLNKIKFPLSIIPYNSDNRRNIGYLMALRKGSDFIISIDDDNFCCEDEDFYYDHSIVSRNNVRCEVINNKNTRWYNICDLLILNREGSIYPRGFPYFARHEKNTLSSEKLYLDIHMNAGLWLKDPDVDGITWLVNPAKTTEFKNSSLVLGRDAWSPINTQNTSMRRDVLASYYFVKMGYPLAGIPIDRYGDIFSGYFSQACIRHLGGSIRVGSPVAIHKRNTHNHMKDAYNEWACIMVLEDLLQWLPEAKLEGNNYADAYESLSYAVEEIVESFNGIIWNDATRAYFHQIAFYMRKWASCCRQFL